MTQRTISFVIPCYRSEKTIAAVTEEIMAEMTNSLPEFDYEIILVNDCSPDNVWQVIRTLSAQHPQIRGISLARNFGQHAALMAGYRACCGELIVSLDDDGQAPIESVRALIDKLDAGYDVVFGRYQEIKQSAFRRFGTVMNTKMCELLLDKPKDVISNSFFGMRRFVMEEMLRYKNCYPYLGGLIFRTTRNLANIDVVQRDRAEGTSGYSLMKLIMLWLNGFTAFSVKPLRVASVVGAVRAALGFLWGIYTVVHKLVNPDVLIGYSSLAAIILFVGGMIMLMLGLIGEYVGRIYISLNDSPQYVIRECCGMEHRDKQDTEI